MAQTMSSVGKEPFAARELDESVVAPEGIAVESLLAAMARSLRNLSSPLLPRYD